MAPFDRPQPGRYNGRIRHALEGGLAKRKDTAETITPEIFEHLVQLAAFDLNAEESEYLRKELNAQLSAIRELEAIDIDPTVAITSHGVPYAPGITPALRQDEILACPEVEDILAGAPARDERYIQVPDIPHEELE
jgi:aspartyl-tRNA(Asn)/glutamyl-tRNA(Gln) amidotransferase subunit C